MPIPDPHFGAAWGGHVTDKVTFWELRRGSKNELEFDVHEEGAQIGSIAILMRLGIKSVEKHNEFEDIYLPSWNNL